MSFWEALMTQKFLQYALIGGVLISLCAALLGVSLVLKRYAMIGDGVSHVSFGALAIAAALGWTPLYVSIPVVIVAAFFLLRLTENSPVQSDSAIAMISASALAAGVVATSLTDKSGIDVHSYMFGSILGMTRQEVIMTVILTVTILLLYAVCYHRIFAVTFDESFSKAIGVPVNLFNTVVSVFTAIMIVLGMRMMGAMLISSLIIFPAVTSMQVFRSFLGVTLCSGILAVVNFLVGMVATYYLNTAAGASVVLVNLVVYLLFSLAAKVLRRE